MLTLQQTKREILKVVRKNDPNPVSAFAIKIAIVKEHGPDTDFYTTALLTLVDEGDLLLTNMYELYLP